MGVWSVETALPLNDGGAWLGSPIYRWNQIHGVQGFFSSYLHIPKKTGTISLADKQLAIDSSSSPPRLCIGVGSND